MRVVICGLWMAGLFGLAGCEAQKAAAPTGTVVAEVSAHAGTDVIGFDRNDYPDDEAMAELKNQFAYTGYWLTPPPGATTNGWTGKRAFLRAQGYGFLVLANGRLDKEIKASKLSPAELGRKDAANAVASAKTEGFPARTIIFLDQEEGGRLLPEQAGYLFGWSEAVAATGFRPGVYASGQPLPDGPGATITTIQDIRAHVAKDHLHPIAIWAYQDACAPKGPSPGCTVQPPSRDASGTPDVTVWQYAQSPRRPDLTQSCAQTYETDGNCYAPGDPGLMLDMNVAGSTDPSGGR